MVGEEGGEAGKIVVLKVIRRCRDELGQVYRPFNNYAENLFNKYYKKQPHGNSTIDHVYDIINSLPVYKKLQF